MTGISRRKVRGLRMDQYIYVGPWVYEYQHESVKRKASEKVVQKKRCYLIIRLGVTLCG